MLERSSSETSVAQKAKTTKGGKASRVAKKAKKRAKRVVTEVIAFIQCSKNNTIATITDLQGNTLTWSSAGERDYTGSKKPTPAAAGEAVKEAATKAVQMYSAQKAEVRVKGPGAGRESAVRALNGAGLQVTSIHDRTPIAHGGCRPKKRRRV